MFSSNSLTSLLIVALLVMGAGAVGALVRKLGQPRVIGMISWGVGVGSIQAATLAHEGAVITERSRELVHSLGQLGLVIFMFGVGHELRIWRSSEESAGSGPGPSVRAGSRPLSGLVVTVVNLLIPFGLGVLVALPLRTRMGVAGTPAWSTAVFMGLALAVTAVPVLALIIAEHGMGANPVARLALSLAIWCDGLIWGLVTVLVAVAGRGSLPSWSAAVLAMIVLVALVFGPELIRRRQQPNHPDHPDQAGSARGEPGRESTAMILPLLVVSATLGGVATQALGLHPAIGSLLAGFAVRSTPGVRAALAPLLVVVEAVLLPLFFVDLAIDAPIQSLTRLSGWACLGAVAVLVVAIAGKLLVAGIVGAVIGYPWSERVSLGALLTCRGVTELAVAAVGVQAGLIATTGFAVLTVVALVGTALTAPLLRLADRLQAAGRPSPVPAGPHRWSPGSGARAGELNPEQLGAGGG